MLRTWTSLKNIKPTVPIDDPGNTHSIKNQESVKFWTGSFGFIQLLLNLMD